MLYLNHNIDDLAPFWVANFSDINFYKLPLSIQWRQKQRHTQRAAWWCEPSLDIGAGVFDTRETHAEAQRKETEEFAMKVGSRTFLYTPKWSPKIASRTCLKLFLRQLPTTNAFQAACKQVKQALACEQLSLKLIAVCSAVSVTASSRFLQPVSRYTVSISRACSWSSISWETFAPAMSDRCKESTEKAVCANEFAVSHTQTQINWQHRWHYLFWVEILGFSGHLERLLSQSITISCAAVFSDLCRAYLRPQI